MLDDRLDRLRLELAGALADAADAVVREDVGEDPVAPARADDVGVDARDAAILAAVDDHAAASFGRAGAADPLLPALLVDVEEGGAVVRVLGDLFGHDVDAEARRVGQRKMALRVHRRRPGDELLRPGRVEGVEMLLDHEVGHGGGELEADRRGDRAAALVGRDVAAMRRREMGHGDRVGDAAERHRLGLEDVDAAALGEGEELADAVVHLAGRDADRRMMGHVVHRLLAVARGRLLPPVDVESAQAGAPPATPRPP